MKHFSQADRELLVQTVRDLVSGQVSLVYPAGFGVYRKRSRILALELLEPFTVETDRGVMAGAPGDYLATNHPDDDAGSDLWTISRERLEATYEPVP